mgnify:CR=1 FL=1
MGNYTQITLKSRSWVPRVLCNLEAGELLYLVNISTIILKSVDKKRIGERVIVRTMQEVPFNHDSYSSWTVGSECNGGFAQYTSIRSSEAFSIISNWSDVELGSIPCAYSTAEGLLYRSKLKDEIVFITGGSGGVGSAAIQLAKLRGSKVIVQCSENKHKDVLRVGADKVIDRNSNIIQELGKNSVDVVIDLVAGDPVSYTHLTLPTKRIV